MRVKRCSKRRSHPYTKNNCSVVDEFLNNETLTMNGAVTLKTTHSALVGKYLRMISLKCINNKNSKSAASSQDFTHRIKYSKINTNFCYFRNEFSTGRVQS